MSTKEKAKQVIDSVKQLAGAKIGEPARHAINVAKNEVKTLWELSKLLCLDYYRNAEYLLKHKTKGTTLLEDLNYIKDHTLSEVQKAFLVREHDNNKREEELRHAQSKQEYHEHKPLVEPIGNSDQDL